jgi:formate hydrogenlyase subunit 3/multisubunit Na+/H+ antiporter MnhD subunit
MAEDRCAEKEIRKMISRNFTLDNYGIFLGTLFMLIGLISFIYALATIRQKGHRLEYYLVLTLIVVSGVAAALSKNLLFIYVCWEVAAFAVWRAVGFYRRGGDLQNAMTVFIMNFTATVLMLVGILILYVRNATVVIDELSAMDTTAIVLIVLGIMVKSVILPLHTWLVPAYRAIPSAIGGCLAGVTENLGVVLFLRLFTSTALMPPDAAMFISWLAIISSIIGGGAALFATNLRELLAYSTISQVGFILLGFAVGGKYGAIGGLLFIVAHALAKSGLFYGVGMIEDVTGKDDLRNIGCLVRLSPTLAISMALLFGSIVGFFPLIGFFAKLYVVFAAVEKTAYLGVAAIVSAAFTVLYNSRFSQELFFNPKMCELVPRLKRPSTTGTVLVFVLALISIMLGIFFYQPIAFLMGGSLP